MGNSAKLVTNDKIGFKEGFRAALGFYAAQALISVVAIVAFITVTVIIYKLTN